MKKINKTKRINSQNKESQSVIHIFKYCFLFTLLFFVISATIITISSLFLFNTNDPTKFLSISLKATLYFSVLLCSIALSKKLQCSYIFSGLVFGCMIFVIFFIISFFSSTENSIIWMILIPAFSIIGSLLGVKRNIKPHKRRHK